jgi:xanthine dehydrogenase accessory factor
MTKEIYRSVLAAIERGERVAILTLIEATGSSPGKPGQKMIAYADGRQEGTIGGGALEHRAKTAAIEMLARGEGGLLSYALDSDSADSIGAICGGRATIAVEVAGPAARILLCGGGHVAWAFARLCGELGFVYTVVDARKEMANAERFPDAAGIVIESPARYAADPGLARFTHAVVLTHDHALDRETLLSLHRAGFSGYVGMIGSRRKWAEVRAALAGEGVPASWLDAVHCPIGEAIGARNPAEIAISIAAEIVKGIRLP